MVEAQSRVVKCANGLMTRIDGRHVDLSFEFAVSGKVVRCIQRCYLVKGQEDEVSFSLEAMRKANLIGCLHEEDNPCSQDVCEEDLFLEDAERDVTLERQAPIKFDVNENFPEKERLLNILNEYEDVFGDIDENGMDVPPMTCKVKEGAIRKAQTCRFVAPHLMPKLRETIDKMVEKGVIEPTVTAEYASPLVLVLKSDGDLRVAVDFRDLNNVLVPFAGSIPDMRSLFPYVVGNEWYAKVDNISGYYQLKLRQEDWDNTAIITPFGLFRFKRCPFGLSPAPGVYQNRMNDIVLRGLVPDTCVVFIDDTIVKGKSVEGFLFGLVEVLKRMRQFNVKLKASKCRFGYNSVEFVGHVFDKSGYSLSDKRKREIMDLPEPKDLKSLRRVLGLGEFFS